jgi:hypothetical protein
MQSVIYAECHVFDIIIPSVIKPSVVMLNVGVLSVVAPFKLFPKCSILELFANNRVVCKTNSTIFVQSIGDKEKLFLTLTPQFITIFACGFCKISYFMEQQCI